MQQVLRPAGSVDSYPVDVFQVQTKEELICALEHLRRTKKRFIPIGAQRSFGQHFVPVEGAVGLDVSSLERNVEVLEEGEDGSLWVRAGAGIRFIDLRQQFPEHRVLHPPTTDTITLGGAFAACVHNMSGYFASGIRAFELVLPTGEEVFCSAEVEGVGAELFSIVPGAMGALGVVCSFELLLQPVARDTTWHVHSLYAGPVMADEFYRAVESGFESEKFAEGCGAFMYGNRGWGAVVADEQLPLGSPRQGGQAPLTDDKLDQQAFAQGIANRFPRVAEWIVRKSYSMGAKRWAPWYGAQFFQRGYDRAFDVCSRSGLKYGLARAFGVDGRLPIMHQAWFFPREQLRNFMKTYFEVLDQFPDIESRAEQQDLVLLQPCAYPAHSMGQTSFDLAVVTSSFTIPGSARKLRPQIEEFYRRVSAFSLEKVPGTRVSLCKQVHADSHVLKAMHAPWIELIGGWKKRLDPEDLLCSRHLEDLFGSEGVPEQSIVGDDAL
ncbi:MAG: FAD-binding protein [Polyangiaceae bacterium]|nr:FAD-binding protein [Polyangiaceae bacterium]